jgi:hypothetical protein
MIAVNFKSITACPSDNQAYRTEQARVDPTAKTAVITADKVIQANAEWSALKYGARQFRPQGDVGRDSCARVDHGTAGACAVVGGDAASASMTETDANLSLLPDCRLGSFHRFCDLHDRRPRFRVRFEFTQVLLGPWGPSHCLLLRHDVDSLSTGRLSHIRTPGTARAKPPERYDVSLTLGRISSVATFNVSLIFSRLQIG